MKRLWSLLLCLALLLGVCPGALAVSPYQEMTAGEPVTGSFSAAGEVLRFRLTLSAPGSVRLQLNGAACGGQLFTLDELGHAEAVERAVSLPGRSDKYRVAAGTYEIRLTARAAGSFTLILYHNDESAGSFEREPNNLPDGDATPIRLGQTLTGNAQDTIDNDYYLLSVPFSATIRLQLTLPGNPSFEGASFYVRLYDLAQNQLLSLRVSEGTQNATGALALAPGRYYLRVYPSSNLSLYTNEDYRLSVLLPYGPSDWAVEELYRAAACGLIPGSLQTNYQQYITRQEFCLLVTNMLTARSGLTLEELLESRGVTVDPDAFSDTDDASVLAAYALGVVKGRGTPGIFDPYSSITRQEAAVMLARAAAVLGVTEPTGDTLTFTDPIADWAQKEVTFVSGMVDPVSGNRVMQGTNAQTGAFSPLAPYTREASYLTMIRLYGAVGAAQG